MIVEIVTLLLEEGMTEEAYKVLLEEFPVEVKSLSVYFEGGKWYLSKDIPEFYIASHEGSVLVSNPIFE